MKTSEIEVRDMLSVLSVQGVESRIGEVPGVESVTVNYAGGSATVRYDETRLSVGDIKSAVRQGEYERSAAAGDGDEGGAGPGLGSADPAHAEAKPGTKAAVPPGAAAAAAEIATPGVPAPPAPPKPPITPPLASAAPTPAPEAEAEPAPSTVDPAGAEHGKAAMTKP